jgi:hypothetical protein
VSIEQGNLLFVAAADFHRMTYVVEKIGPWSFRQHS